MREWLKNLVCTIATDLAAEAKQMVAQVRMKARPFCLIKTPSSCTREVRETIRSPETSSTKLNTKSKGKCKPTFYRRDHEKVIQSVLCSTACPVQPSARRPGCTCRHGSFCDHNHPVPAATIRPWPAQRLGESSCAETARRRRGRCRRPTATPPWLHASLPSVRSGPGLLPKRSSPCGENGVRQGQASVHRP